ncbi:MAG: C40 family peptidase [Deltaproteobacteria bacterium]|nr:C40 family peptidase [Deltaproteobacteria bacterium]
MPATETSPVLDVAQQYLGRPYRFGSTAGSYDCSGFVRRVFAELGVELPHSAREQFDLGDRIRRDDLAPGDLVFFRTYRKGASHVGIYIAEDKFIHAATRGGQVQVDSLDQTYYASRYLGARRVDPQS